MKLLTCSFEGRVAPGALLDGRVVDLNRAHREFLRRANRPGPRLGPRLGQCLGRPIDQRADDGSAPRDLQALLEGGEESLSAARRALDFVRDAGATGLSHALEDVAVLAPLRRPGKVVCVGLNYRSHLAEIGESCPEYPILFQKPATSIVGPGQPIVLPRVSRQVDYEGELAVVIGRRGKYVAERDALAHVAGYTCANDVSANDIEFRTSQWDSGKMLDTFCPLGPVLLTAEDAPEPHRFRLTTLLNGRTVQESSASDMLFSVPFLIHYISSLATLEPGDVILTGTPAGIGCNQKPQVFLRPGDQASVRIDGIGTLTNPVVAEGGS